MPQGRFGFSGGAAFDAREYSDHRRLYCYTMRFDTILKTLFQSSRLRLLESLTHASVREWINVEIPNARMNKLDLVAWLTDDRLYHLELQSGNDADMARRMVEYYL